MLNFPTISDVRTCNETPTTENPPGIYGAIPCSICRGTEYSGTVTAIRGSPPYTFDIIEGEIPPGLTFDTETGEISGTATEFGSYTFTIRLTDALFNTAELTITIAVLVLVTEALP